MISADVRFVGCGRRGELLVGIVVLPLSAVSRHSPPRKGYDLLDPTTPP